ncbi:Dihydroneopterin aldolase-domain-containing protein [Hypoxylon sp. FL1284]|nr:Dihydroneopterin aldolase-domain-containing protein [Hypoxylon sp. FL1284]
MLSSLWKSAPQKTGGPPPGDGDDKADPPAPLVSTWRARADAGEPAAVVRVRNLQGAIPAGRDAWGRPGKLQPALLSSEVSFARPFAAAAADDRLDAGTVHYGNLSKTLLGTLELCSRGAGESPGGGAVSATGEEQKKEKEKKPEPPRTADVVELLWVRMTGRVVDGSRVALPRDQLPFLDPARLRSLALTVHLPKASLLGAGVSLTTTASFRAGGAAAAKGKDGGEGDDTKGNPLCSYARTLRLAGLHVPTLVGVNANEREARQMLIADVEIDRFDVSDDIHSDVEKMIVKTMEDSSFETLEALASHMADKILSDFRIGDDPKTMRERGWHVKICLEKPIAVPFAECPSIEVTMGP